MVTANDQDMDEAVREAVALLADGQVVALPTETVYGLGADALNPDAVTKIYEVKERPSFDPLIVHVSDFTMVADIAEVPEEIETPFKKITSAFWPGPLTVVLPKKDVIPDIVTSGMDTVGVRQSGNKIFRAIGRTLGRPIAAPSANRFGRISPTSASAVMRELGGTIPLIVDAGACRDGLESTIIRIEPGEKRPVIRILRPGPVTKKELQNFGRVILEKKRVIDAPEAPGQLASHYSPVTPLFLFDKPSDFKPEEGKRYGLLSYKGDPKAGYLNEYQWDKVESLSPGSGKLPEAAVRLFHVMRVLDEEGLDGIVAEPVSDVGLGQAIMDRLRRAAVNR